MKTCAILRTSAGEHGRRPVAQSLQDVQSAIQRKDYATALRIVRPLAQGGDPRRRPILGSMYALGYGVSRSYSEAVNWFRKSAEQGFRMGSISWVLLGQGPEQHGSANWLRSPQGRRVCEPRHRVPGSAQGAVQSKNWRSTSGSAHRANGCARPPIRTIAQAQANLGSMYARGEGVKKDPAQAVAVVSQSGRPGLRRSAIQFGYRLRQWRRRAEE